MHEKAPWFLRHGAECFDAELLVSLSLLLLRRHAARSGPHKERARNITANQVAWNGNGAIAKTNRNQVITLSHSGCGSAADPDDCNKCRDDCFF